MTRGGLTLHWTYPANALLAHLKEHRMTTPTTDDQTKVTVYLTPKSAAALDEAAAITGDTRTDTINRALQVYAYLARLHAQGETLLTLDRNALNRLDIDWVAEAVTP